MEFQQVETTSVWLLHADPTNSHAQIENWPHFDDNRRHCPALLFTVLIQIGARPCND